MPSLSASLERLDVPPADGEWLHLLVRDWQLISDLSFADLLLWLRDRRAGSSAWVCVMHVRPNTGPLVFYDDMVGREADAARRRLLMRSATSQEIAQQDRQDWQNDLPLREEAVPVVRDGRALAVLTRHSNMASMRTPSRLETTYRSTADTLMAMVAAGTFPQMGAPAQRRRGVPRVGDGMVRLDGDGIITYASPNAISALHRFGERGRVLGDDLSRLVTDHLDEHSVVDETLPLVLTGKAAMSTEVDGVGASLTIRSVPLFVGHGRIGALLLLRDVSEMRRQERELLTKDATIREIHHRVKNNLQTVAALLRLQSRRVTDEGARSALQEAERRIGSIALVHETLSRTIDEVVDFDEIVTQVFASLVEVAGRESRATWHFEGSFGRVAAEDANGLAMVVTELVHNAVEHGLAEATGGEVSLRATRRRAGDEQRLTVDVEDDGRGLPPDFRPGRSGLGTQIVTALVQDLRGSITWAARAEGGTRVTFDARLRTVPAERPGAM